MVSWNLRWRRPDLTRMPILCMTMVAGWPEKIRLTAANLRNEKKAKNNTLNSRSYLVSCSSGRKRSPSKVIMAQQQTTWKSQHKNDGLSKCGGRDLMGYGAKTPNPKWPRGAKVALNFVINYEEGGEACLLHGDGESEKLLSEIVGAQALGKASVNQYILRSLRESEDWWDRFHSHFVC